MNVPACGATAPASGGSASPDTASRGAGDLFAVLVAGLTGGSGAGPDPSAPGRLAVTGPVPRAARGAGDTAPSDDAETSADPLTDAAAGASMPTDLLNPLDPSAPAPALTTLLAAAAQAGALGIVAGTPPSATGPAASAATPAGVPSATAAVSPAAPRGAPAAPGLPTAATATGAAPRSGPATVVLAARCASSGAGPERAGPTEPTAAAPPTTGPATTSTLGHLASPASTRVDVPTTSSPAAPAPATPAAAVPPPCGAAPTGPGGVSTVVTGSAPSMPAPAAAHDRREGEHVPDTGGAAAAPGAGLQNARVDASFLPARGTPAVQVSGGASAAMPLARQVAAAVGDNVARLVSRGSGTHRLTLNLQPAALGDVRVVLTVRAGQVRVTLAAGDAARVALLREAPDLHRLLERVGADQPQIVVRELSASAAPLASATAQPAGAPTDQSNAGPATGQPTSGQQGAHLGPDTGGQSQDRRAWTPAATSARDGGSPGTGRRGPDRPIDPATRVRTAGVDVTM